MQDNKYIGVQGLEELIALTKNSLAKKVNSTDILGLENAVHINTSSISSIDEKIPAQASSENKLADKDFVNSSISTNTAYFRGTFESIQALELYSGEKTNNDYAFVVGIDTAGNTKYSRYKWNDVSWVFEYDLNNSSFTAEQWAAIQSGITEEIVQRILSGTFSGIPIGASILWPSETIPAGFLKYDGTVYNKSDYPVLFTRIPDSWKIDENTFKIPDLRGRVAQGADGNLGELIEAGLPNITGSFGNWNQWTGSRYGDGAFSARNDGRATGFRAHGDDDRTGVTFNASRGETKTNGNLKAANEHHVYGASDTVQPPAVALYYIIKATDYLQATEDVIDDSKATTGNVWSATRVKAEIENRTSLDWSNAVETVATNTDENTFNVTTDGVIYYDLGGFNNNYCYVKINNITIVNGTTNGNNSLITKTGSLFVSKGDVIKWKEGYAGSFLSTHKIIFVPYKS